MADMIKNVYYYPEEFGLSIVGEVEFSSGIYQFDTSVVWRDTSGALYYADDSGCSCPSPFEGMGIPDLTKANRLQDVIDYFEKRKVDSYYYDESTAPGIDAAIGEVIVKASAR